MDLLTDKMPKPTQAERQKALEVAMAHLLSVGLTSVHDAGIKKTIVDLYKENERNQNLDVRIYAMLDAMDPALFSMLKAGHFIDPKDMLSIRSVKLSIDGALGSRGAALLAPYSDEPENKGLMLVDAETGIADL